MEWTDQLAADGFTLCNQSEGFSSYIGPFYEKHTEQQIVRALPIRDCHLNPEGVVHGGVLLAFADFVMYRAIGDVVGHQIKFATINLNSQFLAAVKPGDLLCGHGRIVRQSRSVIFADCELYTSQRTVMTASGIWKVLGQ